MTSKEPSETIHYHLSELKLASNPDDPRNILPTFDSSDKVILDIGCGIGQTFVAAGIADDSSRVLIGLDNEIEPLIYGAEEFSNVKFINALADQLPIATGSIDKVVSRVTIPYTNIPVSLQEINRVLKPGGEIWMTLHSMRVLLNPLLGSSRRVSVKSVLIRTFFLFNGFLLHCFGTLLPLPGSGSRESFQTSGGIRRLLKKNNFEHIVIERGSHFLVTARKRSD